LWPEWRWDYRNPFCTVVVFWVPSHFFSRFSSALGRQLFVTNKVLPSGRRRLIVRLAAGLFSGLIVCWIILALAWASLPE